MFSGLESPTSAWISLHVGRCSLPLSAAVSKDHVEVDLRYGTFVLRETDLQLSSDPAIALTRGYTSGSWPGISGSAAFGFHSSHDFDWAPLGSRNPYLDQVLVLADGQTIFFKRISAGTGYPDAVYQHSETATRFYGAITGWNGNGWTTLLRDGSVFRFPESYNAKNLAQGAAVEMREGPERTLKLVRNQDGTLKQVTDGRGHWLTLPTRTRILMGIRKHSDQPQPSGKDASVGLCHALPILINGVFSCVVEDFSNSLAVLGRP